jgi:peptide/nickel transport system substrate-binding protein
MINKTTKLRWRRILRRKVYEVENLSVDTEQKIEKHFFKRLSRLGDVKRFIFSWIMLIVLLGFGTVMQLRALSTYYLTLKPTRGGIYTEGILGKFTSANPIYATNSVDSSVSRLIFSGLMKFNSQNQLVGDLAKSVKRNETNDVFTIELKKDIYWHDSKPITSDDVVFTYKLIQNPDAKSPFNAYFKSMKIEKLSEHQVKFALPHPLSAFPQLLTIGLLPKHKLDKIPAYQLRSEEFNTVSPIGSGPFVWDSIQISGQTPESREEQIGLSANKDYYEGVPELDKFIIKAIRDENNMISQFNKRQIDAMVGLDKKTDNVESDLTINEYEFSLNAQVMVFLKTSNDVLKDKSIRQALTMATDRTEIIRGLGYAVKPVRGPFLLSHLGYRDDITQLKYSKNKAEKLLEKSGWTIGPDGIRAKNKVPLSFSLTSKNNSEYAYVSQILQRQWRDLGIDLKVDLLEDAELQSAIALHNYDSLLYGITVGGDPDVYSYWHSSQADVRSSSRLNFSEIQSIQMDSSLEAGRARKDNQLRAIKYKPFLTTWQQEAPAIGLYQPRFLYVTHGTVNGLSSSTINMATDRFANVHNWQVRTKRVIVQ